jgi:type VI secretion system lysozyme-like protein
METPHWSRLYPGARALLFERLVDLDPRIAHEPQPFRTLTIPELRASVRREVERLLNTRCAASAGALEGRERTVLDYGIPDFSALSPQRAEDRQRLARQITQAITAFEPRLRQVRVTVEPPTTTRRCLLAYIEAVLMLEAVTEPVAFPVLLTDEPHDEEGT